MKNINIFFTILLGLFMFQGVLSQQLFKLYNPNIELYNKMIEKSADIDISLIKEKTLFFVAVCDAGQNI